MGEREEGREGGMSERNMSVPYGFSGMMSNPQECTVKHEICAGSG